MDTEAGEEGRKRVDTGDKEGKRIVGVDSMRTSKKKGD